MGMCWWCHWGWPKPIRDIYDKALAALDGDESPLLYGPAHVVWGDENWDSAQWCLDEFESWEMYWMEDRFSDSDREAVRQSLVELVALPDELKQEPVDYDGEHPENFPPPSHWVMVR